MGLLRTNSIFLQVSVSAYDFLSSEGESLTSECEFVTSNEFLRRKC